jgi:hypothetical protein
MSIVSVGRNVLNSNASRALVQALNGDESAPLFLIRIWYYCELHDAWLFPFGWGMAHQISQFPGDAATFRSAILTTGWATEHADGHIAWTRDEVIPKFATPMARTQAVAASPYADDPWLVDALAKLMTDESESDKARAARKLFKPFTEYLTFTYGPDATITRQEYWHTVHRQTGLSL